MKVASFYRFLDLDGVAAFRDELQAVCEQRRLLGTILVAAEGFNGTLTGAEAAILDVFGWIERRLDLESTIDARWTESADAPFRRMRVRIKKEIVTLGRPDILPHRKTGEYVSPGQWNALIEDPDVLVIDTRNRYEVEVGSFPRAVDPGTDSFRQFPACRRHPSQHKWYQTARDVLHRGHPLRESHRPDARTRFRGGVPPAGRHPELPGRNAG